MSETPVLGNIVNTQKRSAQDEYYTYMLKKEKAGRANAVVGSQTLLEPGIVDKIETSILIKLHAMSDLSPQLAWTLSMCSASSREEAAKKLAEKVISKQMTDNLTASLVNPDTITNALRQVGDRAARVNAFGVGADRPLAINNF